MAPARMLRRATSTTMFQSFKLFVGITQILILWLVAAGRCRHVSSMGCTSSSSLARGAAFGCPRGGRQSLLKERDGRVLRQVLLLIFVHFLSSSGRISPVIHKFLFEVEELALEAWVGVDDTSFRFDISHGLE